MTAVNPGQIPFSGKAPYIAVIGGVNVDIGGRSAAELVPGDSNPGFVSASVGGVGRNIAHNLCLLGADVKLLSAWGNDANGRLVSDTCKAAGMDLSRALITPEKPTSVYLYIADPRGDMALAVSDMAVTELVTPAYLEGNLDLLRGAAAVVADTNIPAETLKYLAENCTSPLFCDPVSTAKAGKLRGILRRVHTLKPNRLEAELLTGIPVHTKEDALAAGRCLIRQGAGRAFISLGAEGVCAVSAEEEALLPCVPGTLVSTTGCGAAFMTALAWGFLQGLSLRETALAGLSAASLTAESAATVHPAMSAEKLRARMQNAKREPSGS